MRECDGCNLCCCVAYIDVLSKPANVWCPHCERGVGCKIYSMRPKPCREFRCAWLMSPDMADRYRPDRIGLYVTGSNNPNMLVAMVDPDRPSAWQEDDGSKVVEYCVRELGKQVLIVAGDARYLVRQE